MSPLVIPIIASATNRLLDSWISSPRTKDAGTAAVNFEDVLNRASASSPSRASTAASATAAAAAARFRTLEARTAELRAALLDAPEVRTAVDSSDPAKPLALRVSEDGGALLIESGDLAFPKRIEMTPETAGIARELAALTASTVIQPR